MPAPFIEVEAHHKEVVRVFWTAPSGTRWRIPHDWRRRRIILPCYDVLREQGIPTDVAAEFSGKTSLLITIRVRLAACTAPGEKLTRRKGSSLLRKILAIPYCLAAAFVALSPGKRPQTSQSAPLRDTSANQYCDEINWSIKSRSWIYEAHLNLGLG